MVSFQNQFLNYILFNIAFRAREREGLRGRKCEREERKREREEGEERERGREIDREP